MVKLSKQNSKLKTVSRNSFEFRPAGRIKVILCSACRPFGGKKKRNWCLKGGVLWPWGVWSRFEQQATLEHWRSVETSDSTGPTSFFFKATSNELLTFPCAALKPKAIVIKQAIKIALRFNEKDAMETWEGELHVILKMNRSYIFKTSMRVFLFRTTEL